MRGKESRAQVKLKKKIKREEGRKGERDTGDICRHMLRKVLPLHGYLSTLVWLSIGFMVLIKRPLIFLFINCSTHSVYMLFAASLSHKEQELTACLCVSYRLHIMRTSYVSL